MHSLVFIGVRLLFSKFTKWSPNIECPKEGPAAEGVAKASIDEKWDLFIIKEFLSKFCDTNEIGFQLGFLGYLQCSKSRWCRRRADALWWNNNVMDS